jgi:hypothetical protein
MTCHDMDWIIALHSVSSGFAPEAVEHIAGCERCRRLSLVFDQSPSASMPSEDRMRRIEAVVLHDLAPVQPLAPERVFLTALTLVFLAVVCGGSVLLGTNGWRAVDRAHKLAVFMPLAICAGLFALLLVRLMAPGSKRVAPPTLQFAGALSLLGFVFASAFHWLRESAFFLNGLGCLRAGLMCAAPAAALFWLVLRRGAILSPGLTGLTAGGLAGLVSLTVLEIQCANTNAVHILVWHLGVTVLVMACGYVVGSLWTFARNHLT